MSPAKKIFLPAEIGALELIIKDNKLCELSISGDTAGSKNKTRISIPVTDISKDILKQLQAYFSASVAFHGLPLAPEGTKFEKAVWNELCKIPLGETRTYGEIAGSLNSSPRAVGNACRKNPIAIIIPCHRVIAANGLGGYAGQSAGQQLKIKRWLLQHEGVSV